jgi:hypothetical protein
MTWEAKERFLVWIFKEASKELVIAFGCLSMYLLSILVWGKGGYGFSPAAPSA